MTFNYSSLLWLQFAYSIWQFIRTAKFFRVPYGFFYHFFFWMNGELPFPFSEICIQVITRGEKWTFPTEPVSSGDIEFEGLVQAERFNNKILLDKTKLAELNLLRDRKNNFICDECDLLFPKIMIANKLNIDDGIDLYLRPGIGEKTVKGRILFVNSKNYELNQNFTRLLSIIPLILQARNYGLLSAVSSIFIILLDIFNIPSNYIWNIFIKKQFISLIRLIIMSIKNDRKRIFISTFLSTISVKFSFCDQIEKNFYYIKKGQTIMVNSGTFLKNISNLRPLNDIDFLKLPKIFDENSPEQGPYIFENKDMTKNLYGGFFVDHLIGKNKIRTFIFENSYYNFLNGEHLHFGSIGLFNMEGILSGLRVLEIYGKLPVVIDHNGKFHSSAFNKYLDSFAEGIKPCLAETCFKGIVTENKVQDENLPSLSFKTKEDENLFSMTIIGGLKLNDITKGRILSYCDSFTGLSLAENSFNACRVISRMTGNTKINGGNKRSKIFFSDLNYILIKGNDEMIKNVCQYYPSKSCVESMDKENLEIAHEGSYFHSKTKKEKNKNAKSNNNNDKKRKKEEKNVKGNFPSKIFPPFDMKDKIVIKGNENLIIPHEKSIEDFKNSYENYLNKSKVSSEIIRRASEYFCLEKPKGILKKEIFFKNLNPCIEIDENEDNIVYGNEMTGLKSLGEDINYKRALMSFKKAIDRKENYQKESEAVEKKKRFLNKILNGPFCQKNCKRENEKKNVSIYRKNILICRKERSEENIKNLISNKKENIKNLTSSEKKDIIKKEKKEIKYGENENYDKISLKNKFSVLESIPDEIEEEWQKNKIELSHVEKSLNEIKLLIDDKCQSFTIKKCNVMESLFPLTKEKILKIKKPKSIGFIDKDLRIDFISKFHECKDEEKEEFIKTFNFSRKDDFVWQFGENSKLELKAKLIKESFLENLKESKNKINNIVKENTSMEENKNKNFEIDNKRLAYKFPLKFLQRKNEGIDPKETYNKMVKKYFKNMRWPMISKKRSMYNCNKEISNMEWNITSINIKQENNISDADKIKEKEEIKIKEKIREINEIKRIYFGKIDNIAKQLI